MNHYAHIFGTELHAFYPPGTNTVKVVFDGGWATMGIMGSSALLPRTPRYTKLPMPLRHSDGVLYLGTSTVAQTPDLPQIAPPSPVIYLPFTISAGVPHYR